MTRSIDPLFDPRLADWLEEDPSTAPEQALEIVLASLPSIKQRHAVRVPWRTTSMSSTLRLGLAAAVVVAATIGGIYFLGSRSTSSVAGPETPTPSAAPSVAPSDSPTPSESPTSERTTPPNWATFTSPQYGYTVDHPTAFQVTPATEEWPLGEIVGNQEPWVDKFFAPFGQTTFVGIASQELPEGIAPAEALTAYHEQVAERGCAVPIDAWTETMFDGAPASRAEFACGDSPAVEFAWINGGRGWVISGNPEVVELMLDSFEYE